MHPIKNILVAIKTLDARTLPALRKAVQLAKANGASLELFHALSQTVLIEALDARKISLREFEAEQSAKALKRLNTIAQRVRKHDVEVSCAVEWDYPASEAIVRRALKTRCDLIVAERHASRHVAGWLLAYTDWELLRQAPCPVLLVKTSKPYHRPTVLTAVDPFHEHAKPARLPLAVG
jgi:universal stress protein E